MGNSHISWWRCKFCGASLFYAASYEPLEQVIASHFQRCLAVNSEIVAMFLRMAEQQKAQKKEEKQK
jgi:hypothetical protein